MSELSKRSTIYFDPSIHHALRIKAANADISISEVINKVLKFALCEDQEDLKAIEQRKDEANISYAQLLDDLKLHGKI